MEASLILNDEQLADFDQEYVDQQKWQAFKGCVARDFSAGDFTVLDIGGGNGMFADRVLDAYPDAHVTVLDLSSMLLAKNKPNGRKVTVLGSALELDQVPGRYDIVCFNWVLHHLIGETYARSIANIRRTLERAAQLLAPGGRLSVYDNLYDGLMVDAAPSRIIYALTSAKALARLVRAGGANTAGVGVCFQSQRAWFEHFRECGLRVLSYERYRPFGKPAWQKLAYAAALHLKPEGAGHFWLSRE